MFPWKLTSICILITPLLLVLCSCSCSDIIELFEGKPIAEYATIGQQFSYQFRPKYGKNSKTGFYLAVGSYNPSIIQLCISSTEYFSCDRKYDFYYDYPHNTTIFTNYAVLQDQKNVYYITLTMIDTNVWGADMISIVVYKDFHTHLSRIQLEDLVPVGGFGITTAERFYYEITPINYHNPLLIDITEITGKISVRLEIHVTDYSFTSTVRRHIRIGNNNPHSILLSPDSLQFHCLGLQYSKVVWGFRRNSPKCKLVLKVNTLGNARSRWQITSFNMALGKFSLQMSDSSSIISKKLHWSNMATVTRGEVNSVGVIVSIKPCCYLDESRMNSREFTAKFLEDLNTKRSEGVSMFAVAHSYEVLHSVYVYAEIRFAVLTVCIY